MGLPDVESGGARVHGHPRAHQSLAEHSSLIRHLAVEARRAEGNGQALEFGLALGGHEHLADAPGRLAGAGDAAVRPILRADPGQRVHGVGEHQRRVFAAHWILALAPPLAARLLEDQRDPEVGKPRAVARDEALDDGAAEALQRVHGADEDGRERRPAARRQVDVGGQLHAVPHGHEVLLGGRGARDRAAGEKQETRACRGKNTVRARRGHALADASTDPGARRRLAPGTIDVLEGESLEAMLEILAKASGTCVDHAAS